MSLFSRLIKRFRNIVIGQFFGHTHKDEFQIFFNGTEAINMAFLAPSETTLDGLNPAYRIYQIDGKSQILILIILIKSKEKDLKL